MNKANISVKISNKANLPTKFGDFNIVSFQEIFEDDHKDHFVLYTKKLDKIPLVRIHSECLTGDVFGSLKCDCGPELEYSLKKISEFKNGGIIIYLRQEGRDIGLFNKVNAYNLQDKGRDTVQANIELNFKSDNRCYSIVKNIFDFLKIDEIYLLTNNPNKIEEISKFVKVNREEIIVGKNKCNEDYLEVKKNKMGHLL